MGLKFFNSFALLAQLKAKRKQESRINNGVFRISKIDVFVIYYLFLKGL